MVGLQFAGDTAPYQAALREGGLLAPGAGGNVIRLLPPLIATPSELDRSVEILRSVLQS
jgi:acetylornithine aminotransferase/acetylornithine/N-succinyldiaminopimelate aminotransferase